MRATCAFIFNSSSLLALNLLAMLMVYVVLFRLSDIRIFYGHFRRPGQTCGRDSCQEDGWRLRQHAPSHAHGAGNAAHERGRGRRTPAQWRCRREECGAADEGQPATVGPKSGYTLGD
jgi:hypothetical protein